MLYKLHVKGLSHTYRSMRCDIKACLPAGKKGWFVSGVRFKEKDGAMENRKHSKGVCMFVAFVGD